MKGGAMYATVRRYEGVLDPDEVAKRTRESFVPLISSIDGFIAYYLVDAGDGVLVSTSLFETQAYEEESNEVAAAWVKANVAELEPNPPVISAGHVVATK
jgi:hypothetical protein